MRAGAVSREREGPPSQADCRVVVLANMADIPCSGALALTRMANSEVPELA